MYFYLDTEAVYDYLRLYCDDASEGILYLVSGDGTILSLAENSAEYETVAKEEISSSVRTLLSENDTYVKEKGFHIFCSPVLGESLYLVNVVPESRFLEDYIQIRSTLIIIAVTALLFIMILSFLLSFFITKPLKKLMDSLRDIETGSYLEKIPIHSHDEIEQLNDAIDSMYRTIQKQIERIKQEETLKYNAQMQLLSEQMNPHFLYNALEFINMEIVSSHNDNASLMICNLGNYLRTGLAYGENFMPISKEVEHAVSYINIMSYRFSQSIQVTTQIPDYLSDRPIMKCILQPLVENSLKHGFKIGTSGGFPLLPLITISASLTDDALELAVTDNGAGIDIERAEQSLQRQHKNSDGSGHVGLSNVYLRLSSYYTEADITFSSVPFFENKVTVRLPASYFTNTQEEPNDSGTTAQGT
jgi:two-component system sensor histidine kinase YesM